MPWKLLLDCGITELPVKVSRICKCLGVKLCTYTQGYTIMQKAGLASRIRSGDGFLFRPETGTPVIFYNGFAPVGRQRFTVAHELGHLILGHEGDLINREPSPKDNPVETAANIFAAKLLAPACVLRGLRVHGPSEISHFCNISQQAAEFQMAHLEELYRRDDAYMERYGRSYFFQSGLEWKLYQQFEPFIKAQLTGRRPPYKESHPTTSGSPHTDRMNIPASPLSHLVQ